MDQDLKFIIIVYVAASAFHIAVRSIIDIKEYVGKKLDELEKEEKKD